MDEQSVSSSQSSFSHSLILSFARSPRDGHAADIHVGEGMSSVWVKIVSSWIAALIYMWTLVAPACLPNRDFD